MKYTLAQNAVSSLSIAIENFKKSYYLSDGYSQSKIGEAIKVCIIFLENSIELMLKDILASTDVKEYPFIARVDMLLSLYYKCKNYK